MMSGLSSELEQIPIEDLVRYAVCDEELVQAQDLVQRYADHPLATGILRAYYTLLPEGREEMVTGLRLVVEQDGLALIGLATTGHRYLYLGSVGAAVYLGDFDDGVEDESLLLLFGYRTSSDYARQVTDFDQLPLLAGNDGQPASTEVCVACGVAPGMVHEFGCPVELCPWCEGQLSHCNCRFDQLGVDVIENEEQLDRFAACLADKGRIPFQPDQNPSYPAAGGADGSVVPADENDRPASDIKD